jgi:hypothetical protein
VNGIVFLMFFLIIGIYKTYFFMLILNPPLPKEFFALRHLKDLWGVCTEKSSLKSLILI